MLYVLFYLDFTSWYFFLLTSMRINNALRTTSSFRWVKKPCTIFFITYNHPRISSFPLCAIHIGLLLLFNVVNWVISSFIWYKITRDKSFLSCEIILPEWMYRNVQLDLLTIYDENIVPLGWELLTGKYLPRNYYIYAQKWPTSTILCKFTTNLL